MNILLINHYAGSPYLGMEYRPFYMAKEWTKLGHNVTIVAASFSHLRSKQPNVRSSIVEDNIDGIRYVWLKTPKYSGNSIGRVRNMLSFICKLYRYLPKIAVNMHPDVIIASSTYPLDIFPAHRVSKRFNAKLIFEVHDLWPLSPMELGRMSASHPFIRVMQLGEDYACKHADKIVSILPFANRHLETRGMFPEKFVYIPNGVNLEDWQTDDNKLPEEHQKFLQEHQGTFLVGYTGSHGLANDLHHLINAAVMLKEMNIHVVLVGQGPEKNNLMHQASEIGAHNVFFLPPIPKCTIPLWLDKMDCLFIGLKKCTLFKFGISPNKLIDYMMSGVPIVSAVEAGNDPVSEAGCGISVKAENPQAIAEGILKIYNMTSKQRHEMGERGKQYVLRNHTYPILAAKFLQAMK